MEPEGASSQDPSADSDESILARIALDAAKPRGWGIVHTERYRFASRFPGACTRRVRPAARDPQP